MVFNRDYVAKRSVGERGERGEGKLKAIIYTAILVILVVVAVKMVPPYVSEYQLADKIQEEARFGIVNRYNEDKIRDNVFRTVQDLDIPVKREDIKVTVTQREVTIALDYTVPIDFYVYQTELHFSPQGANKSLF